MTGRRLPRPRRATMPVAASAAILAVWGVVAHDSGAGWVQAIGALVAGALVVGMLAPAVAVWRASCQVVASALDATAGAATGLEIRSSAPVELTPVDPPGPVVLTGRTRRGPSGPTRLSASGGHLTRHDRLDARRRAGTVGRRADHLDTTVLEIRPAHRGVLERCTVTVASAAPFGILWWTRTVTLTLPRPLAVAPKVGDEEIRSRVVRGATETHRPLPGRGAEPRGLRPYEVGDRRALVHWRATAHTGSLMVRETERPAPDAAVVDGRLPPDPDEAERQAERVMSTVRALLLAGARVDLETAEPEGEVLAPVASLLDAGRRLARSLPRVASTSGAP